MADGRNPPSGGPAGGLSRREFIELVATSAAVGVAGPGMLATSAPTAATHVLTTEQTRALTLALNRLIPASTLMPAAGDLGLAAFIDKALAVAPHLRRHVVCILDAMPTSAESDSSSDLAPHIDAALHQTQRDKAESFDLLLQAAYTGYYSHPRVHEALAWTDAGGTVRSLPPFDVASLGRDRSTTATPFATAHMTRTA